jgi:hypothetical protein
MATVHGPPIASHPPDMSRKVANNHNIPRGRMAYQPVPPVSKTPSDVYFTFLILPRPHHSLSRSQTSFMATRPLRGFAPVLSPTYLLVPRIPRPQLIRRRSSPISLHTLFTGPNSISPSPLPLWYYSSDSKLVFQPPVVRRATVCLSPRL